MRINKSLQWMTSKVYLNYLHLLKWHAYAVCIKSIFEGHLCIESQAVSVAVIHRQTSFNNALCFQMQHKMRQNTTKIQRGVMEIKEESGHAWYYAQYAQRDGGQKRALMQLLRRSYPQSYSLNIQSSHTRGDFPPLRWNSNVILRELGQWRLITMKARQAGGHVPPHV